MKLKEARQRAHLSQQELADKVGVSVVQISRYENGHAVPYPKTRRKIQEVLGVISWPMNQNSEDRPLTVVEQEKLQIVVNILSNWLGVKVPLSIFEKMSDSDIREILNQLKTPTNNANSLNSQILPPPELGKKKGGDN